MTNKENYLAIIALRNFALAQPVWNDFRNIIISLSI